MALLTRGGSTPSGAGDPNAVIGVWSTASRPAVAHAHARRRHLQRRARAGVAPRQSARQRSGDRSRAQGRVQRASSRPATPRRSIACSIRKCRSCSTLIFGVQSPPAPRNDLVTIFLTGIPGLNQPPNVSAVRDAAPEHGDSADRVSPNRMGVLGGDAAGFPNGRRVGDDVLDIVLQAAAGATPLTPAFNDGAEQRSSATASTATTCPTCAASRTWASAAAGQPVSAECRVSRAGHESERQLRAKLAALGRYATVLTDGDAATSAIRS